MSLAATVVQMTGRAGAVKDNRRRTLDFVAAAADAGARIVVLPELVVSGYTADADMLDAAAEPLDGPTLDAWTQSAARHGVLIAGGLCERDGGQLYNTAVLVGPDGLRLHYRKLHLFDREKLVFVPGDKGLPVVDTEHGRIGICVCYDLRFVEVLRALALQGADLVLVPTAWVGGFDPNPRDAAGLIGQARGVAVQANLNQLYVLCASHAGIDGDTRFLGSSLVASPYGEIVAGPLDEAEERALTVQLDMAALAASRVRSPRIRPREDRRRDLYALRLGEREL